MAQHITRTIWLLTILLAALLGIWPGIGPGQQHWIFIGVIVGWFMDPLQLWALLRMRHQYRLHRVIEVGIEPQFDAPYPLRLRPA